MRSLFLLFFGFIVGSFLLAYSLMDWLSQDLYIKNIKQEYGSYVQDISPLIYQEMSQQGAVPAEVLSRWHMVVGEELAELGLVDVEFDTTLGAYGLVWQDIQVTTLSDRIEIIVALPDRALGANGLRMVFIDEYSVDAQNYFFLTNLALYSVMALVIALLSYIIFRYLSSLQTVSRSLAQGDYQARVPDSRLPVFQQLANDVNAMADTLAARTNETDVLIGAIHHELRIPITRIRLALDMALVQPEPKLLQELLQDMDVDLEDLSQLMEELLALSRLRLKSRQESVQQVDLVAIAKECCAGIEGKNIELKLPDSAFVVANETLLKRAIFNVLENACRYCQDKVELAVSDSGSYWLLEVGDDGPGIEASKRELVLTPFYRVDKSRARSTGGVGLGLAITAMVAKNYDATISIGSSSLGGACIRIRWPK